MVLEFLQAEVQSGTGADGGRGNPLHEEAVTDSLPPKKKPGLLTKIKEKAVQVGHEVQKDAKQVGKQLDHTAKDLNKQAKEHHVVDKVKKAAVAAGSHGLLGPAGVVASKAIEEADKHKPKATHPDTDHKSTDTKKKTPSTHIDLTNPYDWLKHIPKL